MSSLLDIVIIIQSHKEKISSTDSRQIYEYFYFLSNAKKKIITYRITSEENKRSLC